MSTGSIIRSVCFQARKQSERGITIIRTAATTTRSVLDRFNEYYQRNKLIEKEAENKKPKQSTAVDEARESFTNDSAFMIAYERAIETEKKGNNNNDDDGNDDDACLVYDPFARILAGDKGKELSDSFGKNTASQFKLWPDFHKQWTVVRTKFIDDHISRIVQEHNNSSGEESTRTATTTASTNIERQQQQRQRQLQFLNLGAGLDTRTLRLDCMTDIATAYEVDMEAINGPKTALFEAIGNSAGDDIKFEFKCPRRVIVSADMTKDGELETKLTASGFDKETPTIVLAEGLIMYLGDKAESFLDDVSKIAAANASGSSWLILNFMEHPGLTLTTDRVRELLVEGGWKDLTFNVYGDDVLNYGRFEKGYEPSKAFSFVVCRKE